MDKPKKVFIWKEVKPVKAPKYSLLTFLIVVSILYLTQLAFSGLALEETMFLLKCSPFPNLQRFPAICTTTTAIILCCMGFLLTIGFVRKLVWSDNLILLSIMITAVISVLMAIFIGGEQSSFRGIFKNLDETLLEYDQSYEVKIAWDQLQINFKCCGILDKTDWYRVITNGSLPYSCCPPYDDIEYCTADYSYTENCYPVIKYLFKTYNKRMFFSSISVLIAYSVIYTYFISLVTEKLESED